MSKLPMPASSLLGTPLSEDELKSIIGGAVNFERKCICTYTDNEGNTTSASVNADNENDCSEKCKNNCNNNAKCSNYGYNYSVTN